MQRSSSLYSPCADGRDMMTSPPRHLDVYFLLSHVRTAIPDQWVHRFHLALDLAVERRASLTEGLRTGSLYYETVAMAREHQENGYPPGARVIVPLYTREFLHQPPPEYVEYCNGGVVGGRRPHPSGVLGREPGRPGGPRAGAGQVAGRRHPDYEECGLAAMCRLNAFARSYQMIIDRLAERIVAAAEHPDQRPRWVAGSRRRPARRAPRRSSSSRSSHRTGSAGTLSPGPTARWWSTPRSSRAG